jgi:REP element-mobilizing transposase RayT
MSRPLRIQYPHAHYHICCRGNERRRLFWEKKDYERFCVLLEEAATRFELRVFAFVLMTNHVHLMIETPLGNLSRAMHWIKTGYSVWINRSRGRAGHLFQGRYHSVIIEDESHYLELSRYIHLNPVRAGMVKLPEGYEWSSCRDYVNRKQRWTWVDREPVLSELGGRGRKRHERYREFLRAGLTLKDEDIASFRRGWILGSDEFRSWLADTFSPDDKGEIAGMKELAINEMPPVEEAKRSLGLALEKVLPELAEHRGTMMYLLCRMGYRLREIGALFGVSFSAVSQNTRRYSVEKKEFALLERAMSNVKR